MTHFICVTCGTQFAESETPPAHCPICADERQYIGDGGQQWTTLAAMRETVQSVIKTVTPNLTGIGTHPVFAIGQRALLVQTPEGNLLWDCIPYIDEPTMAAVDALGGVDAIAISHPHFYTAMVEWAHHFDAPIYLHAADRQHVMRPDPSIHFWDGETHALFGGLTLIRAGGHFSGGTVAHWPGGAEGKGAVLSGDIVHVVQDRRWVSFMYSYPNLIPLSAVKVRSTVEAVAPFNFDRIYGAWWPAIVQSDAKAVVARSAERYIRHLMG